MKRFIKGFLMGNFLAWDWMIVAVAIVSILITVTYGLYLGFKYFSPEYGGLIMLISFLVIGVGLAGVSEEFKKDDSKE